ncbi:MAG: xanthine dehydrogenase family protein subunit M [Chloroflexi bacterium]|nr:xanthine dehydrogenase family protein subunit M [Chloroflexota bacterium]
MRNFAYVSAGAVDEAIELLGQDGATRPLAGGTDLLPLMKEEAAAPARLVDIKRVAELDSGIQETADSLTLGALTRLADIEEHPLLRQRYTAVAEAAGVAATPQLRNMATLGGNLLQRPRCWYFRSPQFHCWLKGGASCPAREGENRLHALFGGGPCYAAHPSDLATALLALDASVHLKGRAGERTVALAEFFALPEDGRRVETTLLPDELALRLHLPAPAPGTRSVYLKAMDRKTWAFALVSVAAVVRLDGNRITGARVVLGGVAPIPWRAPAAERALVGAEPGPEVFKRASEAALTAARPLQHNAYKAPLVGALLQRALSTLAPRASG